MCKSNLFIYFFKEKSCFNYMPETPLSVIFFQTFIIFFFLVSLQEVKITKILDLLGIIR